MSGKIYAAKTSTTLTGDPNSAANKFKDITGTDLGSKFALNVFSTAFLLEVSKGNVEGHRLVTFFGANYTVGTSEETVWPIGGSVTFPTAATQMTVSSTSSNDSQIGTGLRNVLIVGLDTDFNEISEPLALHATDGQLGVTTVNSYIRINQIIGIAPAGSTGYNEGIIHVGVGVITAGVPATTYSVVDIGGNLTETGFFTIPNGETGHAVQALYDGQASKDLIFKGYQRDFGGLFLRIATFGLSTNNIALLPFVSPGPFPAKSDLEFRGIIDAQTGRITTAFTFLLVQDGF